MGVRVYGLACIWVVSREIFVCFSGYRTFFAYVNLRISEAGALTGVFFAGVSPYHAGEGTGVTWDGIDRATGRVAGLEMWSLACYSSTEMPLINLMTQVLEYSKSPRRDRLTVFFGALATILVAFDWIAAIFAGNWHNGLRSIPVYADLQVWDVAATVLDCGVPLLGIISGLTFVWRCRRGRWTGVVWGVAVVLLHAWNLYAWGRLEIWFWG